MKNSKPTKMMEQYLEVKKQYPEEFVFYRVGDFYELFYDDALRASQILKLTLTKRNKNSENTIPMAGLPHHSSENYISKLVSEGYSVVICDQVGEVNVGKIVERKVTRIITPATVSEETLVDPSEEIKICSIYKLYNYYAFVELNVTNGKFQFINTQNENDIIEKIKMSNYAETLYSQEDLSFLSLLENTKGHKELDDSYYSVESNEVLLKNRFLIDKRFLSKNEFKSTIAAAGSILRYIEFTQQNSLPYIKNLKQEKDLENLVIDSISIKNLELIKNSDGETKKTLYTTMNETSTSLGARKLKDWIQYPTINEKEINKRLNNVDKLINSKIGKELSDKFLGFPDIERITTRIALKTAKPLDLRSLRIGLETFEEIKAFLLELDLFTEELNELPSTKEALDLLNNAITEKPPQLLRDGNVIKEGYDSILDELRIINEKTSDILFDLEENEKKKTAIEKLKIVYNKIDGFFIGVPNSKISLVPDYYILKKELKNEKRYTIPQLRTLEEKLLTSNTKALEKEKELFNEILNILILSDDLIKINEVANLISTIDVLNAFALLAEKNNYIKPLIGKDSFNIKSGRHPVIEKYSDEIFIPNDFNLEDKKLIMLTGSNMGGKSTYMRQNALITIMAHVGSYVPAEYAEIKKVDRIFTRIGSGDNLSEGLSTFMVEMKETANILENATEKSFVLIDEIGRGTSTYDGLSLAWAFADELGTLCDTIFSTHYFELTDLEKTNPFVKNMHMDSKKFKDDVIFLHKIKDGAVFQSYGIEVAKKAGINKKTLEKAKLKLESMTKKEAVLEKSNDKIKKNIESKGNLSIIEKRLNDIDLDNTTAKDALSFLYSLKEQLK